MALDLICQPGKHKQKVAESVQVHQIPGKIDCGSVFDQSHHGTLSSPTDGSSQMKMAGALAAAWQNKMPQRLKLLLAAINPALQSFHVRWRNRDGHFASLAACAGRNVAAKIKKIALDLHQPLANFVQFGRVTSDTDSASQVAIGLVDVTAGLDYRVVFRYPSSTRKPCFPIIACACINLH